MKRILIFLALLLAAYVSFSQSPIYGRLRVISGLYDNYFQNGTDTFKLGWRTDRFQLKYNTDKRFIDFIKGDSSTTIYNKLILESPNDTMLSVRGTVRVSENVILGDSNNYNGLNIVPIGDGIVQWAIENYNDSTLYLAATYDFGETGSDFDVITQGDILIFHDTLNNEYIGKVVMLIPAQFGKWGVISPLRATISIEDALTLVGSTEEEIYKGTLDSIIGNHSIVIGNNNIIDNEQVFIIGNSVTTSQNNTIYVNDDIKIGEITLLPTITITDWTQSSDYLYYMYSNPDIMHFSDAALNYWQVGDVLIMCGMNGRVSDSIPRDVFRVDSIVSIGADSLYHYVTALYGSIEDAYENSDWGAYKGTFVEGRTHNAINIGSDNTIANKGSHIIGLSNYTTTADSTLFVNNITIKSSLKADDSNVQNLLTTENIVVGDSLLFSGSTVTNKIVIDGVFEVSDSVLIVNSAERTSIFNGKVIIKNSTDTALSVRGTSRFNGDMFPQQNITLLNTTNASKHGIIYKDAATFIHNFNYGDNGAVTTDGHNTFIGENAGNLTMGTTATISYHASGNLGVGAFSLYENTTGYYNAALGLSSLTLNTTGYRNSAVGVGSLSSNTIGMNNSAIGYNAGAYTFDGISLNNSSTQSVFIGSSTMALNSDDQNEIVIGYNTTGLGSNTVNIGNTSITQTQLNGKVVLPYTADTTLSVRGNAYVADTTFMEHLEVTDSVTLEDALFDIYHLAPDADSLVVDDDGIINLRTGAYGELRVWVFNAGMYAEYAVVILNVDGSIGIMTENSANVTNVGGTDGNLNIYDGGAYTIIENKLGGNRTIKYTFIH